MSKLFLHAWQSKFGPIGPSQALCNQTHRFKLYGPNTLVFETSQAMPDIPMGDMFTVEARWDVTNLALGADGVQRCQVRFCDMKTSG